MADYQDFEVKVTNNTTLLPAVSGEYYYVVGASNENNGTSGAVEDESGKLFGLSNGAAISIPGQGIPCKQIKATAAATYVFYYIK